MRVLRIAAAIVILQFPTVAIAQVATGDSFVPLDQLQLRNPLNADLVKKRVGETPATYLLALGALEKINHVIEPEDSRLITGTKSTWTFELPDARSTGSIGDFYRAQLTSIGAILFECSGRGCGSSSYWANKIFNASVLYGPEQFQRYYVAELSAGFVVVYVAQRATRDIYVHIEYLHS